MPRPMPWLLPLIIALFMPRVFSADASAGKKSWLVLGTPTAGKPAAEWVEGDRVTLPIEYYVDPEDDRGGTEIQVTVVGPWNDDAGGRYLNKRTHINYPGVHGGILPATVGAPGRTAFTLTLPRPFAAAAPDQGRLGDGGIFIVAFRHRGGKVWPWQRRAGFGGWARRDGFFELDAPTPGNLFTYDQPVEMFAVLGSRAAGGGRRALEYSVFNTKGEKVTDGKVEFTAGAPGTKVPIPMKIAERGTFMLRAAVSDWETRETTFARIPDLEKILGDAPSPFGAQKFPGNDEAIVCARRLGCGSCRVWSSWAELEPAPGRLNETALAALEKQLDARNARHIRPAGR